MKIKFLLYSLKNVNIIYLPFKSVIHINICPLYWVTVGVYQNKYSPFLPIVCHQ